MERVHTNIPATGHVAGVPVKENETAPSCTAPGGYDMVTKCAVCGTELSRAHVDTEALGHEWDEGVVTVEPTETSAGILLYTCVRCGATREEEIPVLPHDCKIAQFTDVMEAYPYGTPEHEAIEWAFTADPQVTAGTSDTTFGVGKAVKRGDAMFYLWVAAGKPEPTLTTSPFTDVTDPKAYYYKAVLWAYEKGIEKGAGGKFNGKTNCLRETVVLWMYRVLAG